MFKRKPPKLCRPCQERQHVGCDGPPCECTFCDQLRELEAAAHEKAEIMYPFPPGEDVTQRIDND